MLYLLRESRLGVSYFILPGVLLLVIVWGIGLRSRLAALVLTIVAVLGLAALNYTLWNEPPALPIVDQISMPLGVSFYLMPALLIVLPAVLITLALRPLAETTEGERRFTWQQGLLLALALLLPLLPSHVIYWGAIWDQTDDGIFAIVTAQPAAVFAIGAGMAMMLVLRGKYRLAGLAFMLLAPAIAWQAMTLGMQTSHHTITEERAARIAEALGQYRGREGRYPAALAELAPGDLLFIPQPVLLPGETWCYAAEADAYRLEAFYREFFSGPVSLRPYQFAGDAPATACGERLAAVQERFHAPMDSPAFFQPPEPTPLPPSALDFPKTPVQPLLEGARAVPGSWSADSHYFFFGAQTSETTMALHFVDNHGALCSVPDEWAAAESLGRQHAWLPDGRVVYLDTGGRLVLLEPCGDEVIDLTGLVEEPITALAARAPQVGRLLLQGAEHYWLMDGLVQGQKPSVRQVTGVAPNPYDLHWDRFAFLPEGDMVAISHLNGRDAGAGSTLYLVAGESGEVLNSLPLEAASDQSAPWIEGLVGRQVMLSSEDGLLLIDLGSQPPQVTDVAADLFDLDADYPGEFASAGWVADTDGQGYYIVLRLNHPRERALYWLHGPDGAVQVVDDELPTVVLTPDGQVWDMSPWQDAPPTEPENVLVRLATGQSTVLSFAGHTPRSDFRLRYAYLPAMERLVVGSEQGVALHRLADGAMEMFWVLEGGYSPDVFAAPDGTALVTSKPYGGLYWLPLLGAMP
jgi:hypothetical protein